MGQTTNQIESYIEDKREDLGANLEELETKVKDAADWKHHFRNRPMTMIGVAFGGGVLLATMMGSRGRRDAWQRGAPAAITPGRVRGVALDTWDHVKGALIAVAASRAKDFIDEVVPGFKQHFDKTAKRSDSSSVPLTSSV